MDLDLRDRSFVVSGANSGIGLAAAQRLLREGARVCCFARDLDRLTAAFADTATQHDQLLLLAGDARRPEACCPTGPRTRTARPSTSPEAWARASDTVLAGGPITPSRRATCT
ncbi:SDR family NAD(P)-dependent oxidoreductase [Tsukamurella conjunctivitidis]|uniref:SDR family NAD(P)-dependent oxidoreductase n=2 Tax=Tsukamurella TaxID=2060 RepID=A0A5C5S7I1_9ACTN|nr:SDR family NAD(P)-dependent oxidoreductase [Tsukamurella columbiensis]TWS31054.1 SDR family NAD(P)-dependent oxidoreductase [Tsukamurella conjunctivitidis]